jgi:hypothetical protein
MDTRTLGREGLEVFEIGLGCMSMTGGYGAPDAEEALATIHRTLEPGAPTPGFRARTSSATSTSSSVFGRSQRTRGSRRRSSPWPGCSHVARTSFRFLAPSGSSTWRRTWRRPSPSGRRLRSADRLDEGGSGGPPYPAAAALSALGTVSFGDTLYQASRIRPSSPIRNDERMIPMYLRP